MAPDSAALPTSGDLSATSLPDLLLAVRRTRFSGVLSLTRNRIEKKVTFEQGAAIFSESNLASESLGIRLMDRGELGRPEHARVSDYVQTHKCQEGAALLALKLIEPKALFAALKDQLRHRIIDCFGWPSGAFATEANAPSPGDEVRPFRTDPLSLIQAGLEAHWGPDRMLLRLSAHMGQCATLKLDAEATRRKLQLDERASELVADLDGTRTLGQALGSAISSSKVLASVWVLDAAGLIDYAESVQVDATVDEPEAELEIEVVVAGPNERKHAQAGAENEPPRNSTQSTSDPTLARSKEDESPLRANLMAKHAQLNTLDYYQLLDVEQTATTAEIKKAYFALAKACHPDAIARGGMADIGAEAESVFSQVSEAFEVLSRPDKRREYDAAQLDSEPEIDVQRLTQAEALFRKGEVLLNMGNFKGAIEFLGPAVELWPDEADYQSAYGWSLYKKSPPETEKAREHLSRALEMAPDSSVVHFRLGLVLRALGDVDGSVEHQARSKQLER